MDDSPTREMVCHFASKNFEKSRTFLHEYSPEAVRKVLDKLARPQDAYQTIHIAGTVAKGSTVKLLSQMLIADGFCVGSFYSPHLLRLNERMQINNKDISNADFARLWEFVKVKLDLKPLSFFDVITVIAFLYFQEKKVDWAVIETGLGGRKDSTNNLKASFSVITPIGLDHQSILGNSLQEIAFEKAGIIHSQPIFSYPQYLDVANILIEEASNKRSSLHFYPFFEDYTKHNYPVKNLNVCRWIYSEYLKKEPINITFELLGRLEVLSKKPCILFDSAHNEIAAKELSFWVSSQTINFRWSLYLNVLLGRSFENFLTSLLHYAEQKIGNIYFLDFVNNKNQFHKFEEISHKTSKNLICVKTKQEFRELLKDTEVAHLICGSMYFYEAVTKEILPTHMHDRSLGY